MTIFVERIQSHGLMGLPVWRLHLLCILRNIDIGIISFRWIGTVFRGRGPQDLAGQYTCPINPTSITSKLSAPQEQCFSRGPKVDIEVADQCNIFHLTCLGACFHSLSYFSSVGHFSHSFPQTFYPRQLLHEAHKLFREI